MKPTSKIIRLLIKINLGFLPFLSFFADKSYRMLNLSKIFN